MLLQIQSLVQKPGPQTPVSGAQAHRYPCREPRPTDTLPQTSQTCKWGGTDGWAKRPPKAFRPVPLPGMLFPTLRPKCWPHDPSALLPALLQSPCAAVLQGALLLPPLPLLLPSLAQLPQLYVSLPLASTFRSDPAGPLASPLAPPYSRQQWGSPMLTRPCPPNPMLLSSSGSSGFLPLPAVPGPSAFPPAPRCGGVRG